MQAFAARVSAVKPFQAASTASRSNRRAMKVACSAMPENQGRRAMLASLAGSLAVLPLINAAPAEAKLIEKVVPANNLSSFQRKDLLADFQVRSFSIHLSSSDQLEKTSNCSHQVTKIPKFPFL